MYEKHLKKFSLFLFFITLFVAVAGWIVIKTWIPESYFKGFLVIPVIFFSVTLALHWYLLRSSRKEIIKFTPRFIGATGIKMLLYIILIVIYLIFNRASAVSFLIWFLFYYFLFTIIEIISILRFLKDNK